MTYSNVSHLPSVLIAALKECGYNKRDINVVAQSKVSLCGYAGDGYRSFAIVVNMSTSEIKSYYGSWGGANPWNPNNRVDLDDNEYVLPENIAVILGTEGGTMSTTATVYISPNNMAKNLLPIETGLTKEEISVLNIFRTMKSSYRAGYLSAYKELIDKLVSEGYLKRSANGATQITISGKNACLSIAGNS